MKVSEITREQFDNLALEKFPELMNKARNAQKIVPQIYERAADFQVSVALSWLKNALSEDIAEASAKQIGVLIAGGRDKKGSNSPHSYAMMTKNRKHFEAITFEDSVPTMDGTKTMIPYPALAEVLVGPRKKGDGLEVKKLIKVKRLTNDEVITKLIEMEAIIDPADIPEPNKATKFYPLVAVKTRIESVRLSIKTFNQADPKNSEMWPLITIAEDKANTRTPTMGIVCKPDVDGTIVTAYMDARAMVQGNYGIVDLMGIIDEAMKTIEKPEDQADWMSGILNGTEVIVIGTVTSTNVSRRGDGRYVNISTHAILQIPDAINVKPADTTPQQPIDKPPAEPITIEEPASPAPKEEQVIEAAPVNTPAPTPKEEIVAPEPPVVKEIREKILFMAGVSSGKQTVAEQKTFLKGQDAENFITKFHLDQKWDMDVIKAVYEGLIQ